MGETSERLPRGEGGVTWDKTRKRFIAHVTLPDGRRVRRSAKTRPAAHKKRRELLAQLERGELTQETRLTVDHAFDRWLREKAIRLRESSYEAYRVRLGHLRPHIGRIRVAKLTKEDVSRAIEELASAGALSPSTINDCLVLLKMVFNDLVDDDLLGKSPARRVKPLRVTRRETRTLTLEQAQLALERTRGTSLHVAWALLILIGPRAGELGGLRWGDWNEESGELFLRRQARLRMGGGINYEAPLKTQSSRRTIVVPPSLNEILKSHRAIQAAQRLRVGSAWEDHDLIVARDDGRACTANYLRYYWYQICDELSIPRVTLHELRHTMSNILQQEGVTLPEVQRMLGHKRVQTTAEIYTRSTPSMRRKLAGQIDAIFWGDEKEE